MARSHSSSHTHRDSVPVSPSLAQTLAENSPPVATGADRRLVWISVLAVVIGLVAGPVAKVLLELIHFFTQLFFYGHLSFEPATPAQHHLGAWVILIPVLGGLIIGLMARWGAKAIRGHGIPEAMEQVLLNQSRIPARITLWKPLSSAVSIGTGGPFGAEGPIIATGGALGSLLGQLLHVTAVERKTLLAAGAAGGMAAVFSAPFSAVLLAVELLLFEFRGRSMIPVALAAATATSVRYLLLGSDAVFPMAAVAPAAFQAMFGYALLGAVIGLLSVGVTRVLYWIEDGFERLPLHWMWWPALGGLAVGLVGYVAPATMGVGYELIQAILNAQMGLTALAFLCVMKFLSWSIALGSGTSGGTLAPLFIIGGAIGGCAGLIAAHYVPALLIDPRVAALVGMAAMFAGASRAFLTSVIFAIEVTHQPNALMPLLAGCALAYLVSSLWMRNTIMTEKITRRGVRVPDEYAADPLGQVTVAEVYTPDPVTLNVEDRLDKVRSWLLQGDRQSHHQGFPVLDGQGLLQGVVTRRDLMALDVEPDVEVQSLIQRAPVVVSIHHSLRDAADHMVRHGVGRLVVVEAANRKQVLGVLTRSDILKAHQRRLGEQDTRLRTFSLRGNR
ncbi:chloride channel protein [Alloalcanivorax mobilis]|uniref:chloride channel protein n=1 Tax=Alloalcanivorax mobilis TaxID=2019569 RepID=UPI000C78E481|nr:chloride channel protein [Alloalcanivorax mobilis]